MQHLHLLFRFLILALSGCKTLAEAPASEGVRSTAVSLVSVPICDRTSPGVHQIREAHELRGEVFLTVDYPGGCSLHDFSLCVARSSPQQTSLSLVHDDHQESCTTPITETLRFDVSALVASGVSLTIDALTIR